MPLLPTRTPTFTAFIAPATARPALWRLILGTLLAAAVWLGATLALLWSVARMGGRPAALLPAYLYAFAGLILGLGLAARLLHRRSLETLIGPAGFRPRAYALGILVVAMLSLLTLPFGPPLTRQLTLTAWLGALPILIPALVIQTAAEELAFRGYLAQGLAARFRSRAFWWVLPALLFGALHWDAGTFGVNAGLVVAAAALTGLVLGDVTARTGNLSLAMGLHFANNALALLLIAPPSPLSRFSLWTAGAGPADSAAFRPLILADIAVTLLAYALWLLAMRRRAGRERVNAV